MSSIQTIQWVDNCSYIQETIILVHHTEC